MVVRHEIMGGLVASPELKALGWLGTGVMAIAVVAMLLTMAT
jgi:hypothetical protein